ncbi:17726_t:CDS:1, partial [Gigaspora margarita]
HLDISYQGGEGVASLKNGTVVDLRCSACVFAYNNQTGERLILTSARCFPKDLNAVLFYHMPWYHPEVTNFFGHLEHISYSTIDVTLIKRLDHDIDLTPQIRSSDGVLFIESFVNNPTDVGQHICISGYEILITCGRVSSLSTRLSLTSLRGAADDRFPDGFKMEVFNVTIRDRDRGGTVFSYISSTGHQRVNVYGMVTHAYSQAHRVIYGGQPIGLTKIRHLREYV